MTQYAGLKQSLQGHLDWHGARLFIFSLVLTSSVEKEILKSLVDKSFEI